MINYALSVLLQSIEKSIIALQISVTLAAQIPASNFVILPVQIVSQNQSCTPSDIRPCWPYAPHKSGWIPTDEEINDIIPRLIACESHGNSVKSLDSNNKYSYGITQIQKATWDGWSKESGITGNPMVPDDALRMTRWAISKGYLDQWSCAYLLGILVR